MEYNLKDWVSSIESLKDLNHTIQVLLDAKDSAIRKEIFWYLDKIEHYSKMLTYKQDIFNDGFPMGEMTREQVKFQFTFWFEAMVWYMVSEYKKMISEKEKAKKK